MPKIRRSILIFVTRLMPVSELIFRRMFSLVFSLVLVSGMISASNAQQVAQDITQNIVTKSPLDQKQYRYLELDNRLKVLLISDSETDQSAAALDVYVGSGSDPEGWQGLAHFLEHMLFLGTKKYPNAGEYQAFIKNNGGSNNAFTSFAHTNYYFSIAANHLEPALHRFSRFFIDPTFDEVYVDRERSIVDSEYQARKKDEHRRLWAVQKQWLNTAHPFSRFFVGSLESLRDRDDAAARETLIAFYNRYYSANIMTLVVLGKEPLEQLQQMVSEQFSQIPNRNVAAQLFTQPYQDSRLIPARLHSIPEKELNVLRFVFFVPSVYAQYRSKPLGYIANLLGHEGSGSLYALLKERGWAEGLTAGADYMDQVQGEFSIRINLTKQGLNHIEDIGELVFQAINLIKQHGINEWRFQEQSKLSNMAFRFESEHHPAQLARSLASRLQRYPPQDVLQGAYRVTEFAPERIKTLLDYLNADKVNVHITSQSLQTDKISSYYDVPYSLTAIKAETLQRWKTPTIHPGLKLPVANPFIPERLEVLAIAAEQDIPQQLPATPISVPAFAKTTSANSASTASVFTAPEATIWYQPDNEFNTPRANFYFNIQSPLANNNVENSLLTELYVQLLNSQLSETIYPAYLADLNYTLYRHARGISVRISGFEDRQSQLLKLIIDALADPEYDATRFNIIKERMLLNLHNVEKSSPADQVVHEIYRLLLQPYWTEQEKIAVIDSLTIDDLAKFVPKFFQIVNVTVLSHGDVSLENTVARSQMLERLLKKSQFIDHVEKPTIRKLDRTKRYLRSLEVAHTDSALVAYFQGNDNSRIERAKMALLTHLLEPDFYNQLRTVNRVGYIVYANMLTIDQTPGLLLTAQSPSYSPVEINTLYDMFISEFSNTLEAMSEQQFNALQSGLVTRIRNKDKNLSERTQRYWREIDHQHYQFDSQQQFADSVSRLTLQELRQYYKNNIVNHAAELLVQSAGTHIDGHSGNIPSQGYVETTDATRFRQR